MGIIILFIEASVLPSINANVVNVNTDDNKKNYSTWNETLTLIGLFKNKVKLSDNYYSFDCILIIYSINRDGKQILHGVLKGGYPVEVSFEKKTGIFTNHIVFAKFYGDYT